MRQFASLFLVVFSHRGVVLRALRAEHRHVQPSESQSDGHDTVMTRSRAHHDLSWFVIIMAESRGIKPIIQCLGGDEHPLSSSLGSPGYSGFDPQPIATMCHCVTAHKLFHFGESFAGLAAAEVTLSLNALCTQSDPQIL